MKEFANWHHPQSYFTRVVSMSVVDDNFQNWCAILRYHFRDIDGWNPKKQIAYALEDSYFQCVGYLLFGISSSDNSEMVPQNSTWVFFFVLTVIVNFIVHTVRNYVAIQIWAIFQNGFNVQCTTDARLDLVIHAPLPWPKQGCLWICCKLCRWFMHDNFWPWSIPRGPEK